MTDLVHLDPKTLVSTRLVSRRDSIGYLLTISSSINSTYFDVVPIFITNSMFWLSVMVHAMPFKVWKDISTNRKELNFKIKLASHTPTYRHLLEQAKFFH